MLTNRNRVLFILHPFTFILCTISAIALSLGCAGVSAQDFPVKPIRILVPFAPGGPTDVVARLLGLKLTEAWGQQVVIDNRGGAGGNIGMGLAAHANPDGYTWLMVSSSFVVNPSLYKSIPYDPYRDLIPVSNLAASPHAFFVPASSPVKSIADLIALAKSQPGKLSIATPGIGTTPDLSARLFMLTTGLDIVPVPYGGGGLSLAAVLGSQVTLGCQAIPPVTPHIKGGRLRAIALTASKRADVLPDVPTLAELGYAGQEADTMQGLLLPAGTPPALVNKIAAEVRRVMALPDIKQRVTDLGFDVIASTPEQFAVQVRFEIERWGKVIKAAGIKAD
jgi:tripartite-type tricarboxylate transporter receptor subunit TctC